MVKHIILWKIKDEYAEKKQEIRKNIKAGLEGLVGVVPGLLKVNVQIEMLESSNADLMLYSELESEEALKGYQKHPAHVKVADEMVRPFMQTRLCIDF